MAPAQVPTPVARWSQMAALGAAICNTLSQLWNVVTSVSKPCLAWRPSLSDQAGSGGYPKTVTYGAKTKCRIPIEYIDYNELKCSLYSNTQSKITIVMWKSVWFPNKIEETSSISVECKPPACREHGLHEIWRDVDIFLWPWCDLDLDVWPWPY